MQAFKVLCYISSRIDHNFNLKKIFIELILLKNLTKNHCFIIFEAVYAANLNMLYVL